MKNKYRVKKTAADGDTIRVYLNHSYWLSFRIYGGTNLYCGHVASCAAADSCIHMPTARRLAIEFLNK